MLSFKDFLALTMAGCTAAFVGVCFYFDYKRRIDPSYMKKVEARRFLQRENCLVDEFVDEVEEEEAIERNFLHQMQLGEARIVCGDIEEGIKNLTKAVLMCEHPTKLLRLMQEVLTDDVFDKLILSVEEQRQRSAKFAQKFEMNFEEPNPMRETPAFSMLSKLMHDEKATEYF